MMEQEILVEYDRGEYKRLVAKYLKEGWRVVPGTVAVATSVGMGASHNILVTVVER